MIKSNEFMRAYMSIIKESVDEEKQDIENNVEDSKISKKADDATKQVCFQTSDAVLIDALNSGFEEVTFSVKAKNDAGEDCVTEVKFKPESFKSFKITDVEEEKITEDEEELCEKCGKSPCECNEESEDDEAQIDECGDSSDEENI